MDNRWARRTVKGGLEANPVPHTRRDDNETIDFDRVMMDSWRPRHVSAQSEIPEHVPGPGSTRPPPSDLDRATTAWLVDQRRAIGGLALVAVALLLVGASAFAAGLALGRHQGSLVAGADSPASSPTPTVHIGAFEVAPLAGRAAALPASTPSAPPAASASVAAAEPGPPPILPIPSSDRSESPQSRPPAATERRRSSRRHAASSARRRARPTPSEPAIPPTGDADTLAAPTESSPRITTASLAKWDEVAPPPAVEPALEPEAEPAPEVEPARERVGVE